MNSIEETSLMPLHRIIATVSLALAIAVIPCRRDARGELKNDSPELKAAFDALEKHLEKTGYDSAALFAHPDFEIYDNIADFFRKSAESEGIRPYNKALKRGDEKEAARVYEEEFEKYKRRIGFDKKKRDLREFMEMYADELAVSEEKFGIPKEVTASVIGLESLFGKTTGKHRAFNVYVSMYVYNYRKKFALSQL